MSPRARHGELPHEAGVDYYARDFENDELEALRALMLTL